jgi:dynein assembly factor 1
MEHFPQLKCLYFEGTAVTSLHGLQTNVELVSLYMHENVIKKIEHINNLVNLRVLNLSDNCIERVEGLAGLNLDTLYLGRNRIGYGGVDDVKGLLECKSLTCIDIQSNHIEDETALAEVFEHMPELRVLYLQNNGMVKKIKNYRKTLTAKLPKLTYLDDRPVFPEDRRNAEAFARGGIEEERKERELIRKENNEREEKNRQAFKDMIAKAKEERKKAKMEEALKNQDMVVELPEQIDTLGTAKQEPEAEQEK